jgi:aryl-alcohol dehydrogenase-like predicted oxidoreductase
LTGKYDALGIHGDHPPLGRLGQFDGMKAQRWGRTESLAASRRYNAVARDHGMTPTQMALAFCYTQWRVASTIIGVTSVAHLEENLAAWGTVLSAEVLVQIDAIRKDMRDPAQ